MSTYTIQMHNGNGWRDHVTRIATRAEAERILAELRTLFVSSLPFRIIDPPST